ncbi:MAG TPA: hypothetical protein VNA19_07525 [Pyrinomonadaceae bacterium]|jgi:hypothetical protein|nr:hypothetical protein [Pyrinomonadaceae bacterium]
MTALFFLAASAAFGAGLIRRVFGSLLSHAEQLMWGTVVGWMLSTLAAYALARALGRMSFAPTLALLALICIVALLLWFPVLRRLRRGEVRARALWRAEYAWLAVLFVIFAPVFWQLYRTRMLQAGAAGIYSGGSSWYDMGLHTAISSAFLYGQNFPPVYTPFPPEPLLYPFLPDFHTALLLLLGMDFHTALVATSLPLALALTGIFYSLARRILQTQTPDAAHAQTNEHAATTNDDAAAATTNDTHAVTNDAPAATTNEDNPAQTNEDKSSATNDARAATNVTHAATSDARAEKNEVSDTTSLINPSSALATCLFLLNGGLGFLYFFEDWRQSKKSFADFWTHLEVNYANIGERQIQWTNFITDTILPQRTSLYGYPVGLIILTIFAVAWRGWADERRGKKRWSGWRILLPAGVLTGLLPFFHTHTYAAVGLLSGFLFLLRPRRAWLVFWTPAVIIAAPHFFTLTGHVAASGFMRFQPGWRGHNEASWLLYWLRNIGLPTLLIIPAWLAAPPVWRRFYLAFVALLVFSLLIVLTPNDYDNIKLIYYWYAATSVLVAAWLVRLATLRRERFLAVLLALACVASGLLALHAENLNRKLFFSREELDAAAHVRQHTAPRALFLTASTIHQPVMSLAGRPILRGDTAWLWSHGYEFQQREADVRNIYAGDPEALELLRYYSIEYIYLGQREREILRANQAFFDNSFPVLYRSATITIYDARPPAAKHEARADENDARAFATFAPREYAARLERDPYQLLVEFPRASYAVYRYHMAAYGRRPKYAEFMDDMRVAGRGVYPGAHGWQQVLEDNKRELTDALVKRDDFKTLLETTSNAQYVAALYANAGVQPAATERDALVAALDARKETRASVLRRVAENRTLLRREYNAAYVLMHYFGYLRRNPDDPPDSNLEGYNFWLRDLDRTGDYRSVSRVFIESGEYKDKTESKVASPKSQVQSQ